MSFVPRNRERVSRSGVGQVHGHEHGTPTNSWRRTPTDTPNAYSRLDRDSVKSGADALTNDASHLGSEVGTKSGLTGFRMEPQRRVARAGCAHLPLGDSSWATLERTYPGTPSNSDAVNTSLRTWSSTSLVPVLLLNRQYA